MTAKQVFEKLCKRCIHNPKNCWQVAWGFNCRCRVDGFWLSACPLLDELRQKGKKK
jgi:hypothetical protein